MDGHTVQVIDAELEQLQGAEGTDRGADAEEGTGLDLRAWPLGHQVSALMRVAVMAMAPKVKAHGVHQRLMNHGSWS